MAKLNDQLDSDEEDLPDVYTILQRQCSPIKIQSQKSRKEQVCNPLKQSIDVKCCEQKSTQNQSLDPSPARFKTTSVEKKARGQRSLKSIHVNSLLLPILRSKNEKRTQIAGGKNREILDNGMGKYSKNGSESPQTPDQLSDSEEHLSDFIANDSASDTEDTSVTSSRPHDREPSKYISSGAKYTFPTLERVTIDLTSPTSVQRPYKLSTKEVGLQQDFKESENYFEDDPKAYLRL